MSILITRFKWRSSQVPLWSQFVITVSFPTKIKIKAKNNKFICHMLFVREEDETSFRRGSCCKKRNLNISWQFYCCDFWSLHFAEIIRLFDILVVFVREIFSRKNGYCPCWLWYVIGLFYTPPLKLLGGGNAADRNLNKSKFVEDNKIEFKISKTLEKADTFQIIN